VKAESLLYDLHLESINPEHRLRLIRGAFACCIEAEQWHSASMVTELIDNAPCLLLRDLPIEYAEWFKWLLVHGWDGEVSWLVRGGTACVVAIREAAGYDAAGGLTHARQSG
jgi:hypothetical protein